MLSEALLRLVEKRSFRKISVGDICREAQVSRSAFYSHFDDKYELLSYCLEKKIRSRAIGGQAAALEDQILDLLNNVQENRRTFHNIFMADVSIELMNILQQTLKTAAAARLEEVQREGAMLPCGIDRAAEFISGGMASVILGWIRENCATPVSEIAGCQSALLAALLTTHRDAEEGRK